MNFFWQHSRRIASAAVEVKLKPHVVHGAAARRNRAAAAFAYAGVSSTMTVQSLSITLGHCWCVQ